MRSIAAPAFPLGLTLIALVAGSLTACSRDMPSAPRVPQASNAALPNESGQNDGLGVRPIKGSCDIPFAPPPVPLPPVWRQDVTGSCQLSHLGKSALFMILDVDFAAGTQRSEVLTYTAANGDVLQAVNVGTHQRIGSTVHYYGTLTFIGGTGRFKNARGEASANGVADFVARTSIYEISGWIQYDAPDRHDH
jgi:hypothetical protein